jgi:hypothetical protein
MRPMTRTGRRIVAAAAAVIACGAIAVPAIAQASSAQPQATPQCTAGQTYVWLALAPNGAAGTIFYPIEFTNTGSHACWLYGYPGVSAVNTRFNRLGPPAGRYEATPRRVTLRAGQSAHALLGIVEAGFISGCRAATAAGLGVYPPNQRLRQVIGSFTFRVCTKKVSMRVYPVQSGIGVP